MSNPYRIFEKNLKSKMTLKELKEKLFDMATIIAIVCACTILIGCVLMLGYSGTYLAVGDKTNRYCFIAVTQEQDLKQVVLKANRGWGFDDRIGVFSSHDEALEVAKKLNCEMK